MKNKFRRFVINVLCGFVPGEHKRRTIRVVLNTNFISIYRFIKSDCGIKHPKLKVTIGSCGRNLVVNVSDKYVYKFRVAINNFDDSFEKREYEITSELAKVSPVPIIVPKIIRYEHGIARRYDFVSGINFKQLVKDKKHEAARDTLTQQLAQFVYSTSSVDPASIRKYKQDPKQEPGYMLGWYHVDLFENFLIDEKSFRINAVIDWEDVSFNPFDLNNVLTKSSVFNKLMKNVKTEYDRLYNKNN